MPNRSVVVCLLAAAGLASNLGMRRAAGSETQTQTAPAIVETSPQEPAVLVGAGDIANCDLLSGSGAQATARVLDRIRGTVFTVGDHAYPAGTAEQYRDCY